MRPCRRTNVKDDSVRKHRSTTNPTSEEREATNLKWIRRRRTEWWVRICVLELVSVSLVLVCLYYFCVIIFVWVAYVFRSICVCKCVWFDSWFVGKTTAMQRDPVFGGAVCSVRLAGREQLTFLKTCHQRCLRTKISVWILCLRRYSCVPKRGYRFISSRTMNQPRPDHRHRFSCVVARSGRIWNDYKKYLIPADT